MLSVHSGERPTRAATTGQGVQPRLGGCDESRLTGEVEGGLDEMGDRLR